MKFNLDWKWKAEDWKRWSEMDEKIIKWNTIKFEMPVYKWRAKLKDNTAEAIILGYYNERSIRVYHTEPLIIYIESAQMLNFNIGEGNE